MERPEQGPQRGIPRLSRLPLPRAASAANTPDIHQDDVRRDSHLPKPISTGSLRLKVNTPLSGTANQSLKSRYGWSQQQDRNRSPVRDSLQAAHSAVLETTPPSDNVVHYVDGDENSASNAPVAAKQKARSKPRPSLSERTVETLSQIPPSPSPSRRRSSVASRPDFVAPTTTRPISPVRAPRPSQSLRGRPKSPTKRFNESSSLVTSPTDDAPPASIAPNYGQIYTPPRAFVRGPPLPKPHREVRRSITLSKDDIESSSSPAKPNSNAHKAKSMYDLRGTALKSASSRPPLTHVFKDVPKPSPNNKRLSSKSYFEVNASSSLMKPRSPGENVLASSTPTKTSSSTPSKKCSRDHQKQEKSAANEAPKPTTKSSLSLRETIAQAKAAKKAAERKASLNMAAGHSQMADIPEDLVIEMPVSGDNGKVLQKRIESAVSTGTLNIAAMNLKALPEKILKMYEFDSDAKISWSEAVDLTKLNAANNELEDLSDDFFPDWSLQEIQDDENKSNQFGGLQTLELRSNCLSALPIGLRRLQKLNTLSLSNNNLSLDAIEIICQIPSLEHLDLSNNKLQGHVPKSVAQLFELKSLDLHSNRLEGLPDEIASLQKLQRLDLSDNRFSTLPMESIGALSLIELNISKNQLSGMLFERGYKNEKLQLLNVACNRLQSFCAGDLDLANLQTFVCDNNQLTTLPSIARMESLLSLTASENKLEQPPHGFTDSVTLRTVNFSSNHFKVLDPLISRMDSLAAFDITANPLRNRKHLGLAVDALKVELSKQLIVDEPDQSNTHTSEPAISQTGSESLSERAYAFTPSNGVLNLSSKNLSTINPEQVDLSYPIHTIRLSNNDLSAFPEELLKHPKVKYSLKTFDISHNQSLHPTAYLLSNVSLPVLQSLYVVSTGLTSLEALTTYLSAPELRELNISCHRMTGHIPWVKAWFPSITALLATDNWFTSIDVEGIRGLEVVDISNNDIDYLPPKIGELGNLEGSKPAPGRLRTFECIGNKFRIPRYGIIERGTEAILKDLRRMIPAKQVGEEWRD